MTVEQQSLLSEWACDLCHDTGRILEVWGWTPRNQFGTGGKAYGCPNGCTRLHDLALPHERIIKHKDSN